LKAGRRLVLYAPTFRDYQRGAIGLNREQMLELNSALQRMNVLLAIRPHPADSNQFQQLSDGLSQIICADSGRWPDANAVLAEADALITDYSSIWLEFLLLNRPVLAYLWDHERYLSSRGLLLDLPALFPGHIAVNFAQLLTLLLELDRSSFAIPTELTRHYATVTQLFHLYRDGRSCERIVAAARQLK
jgi:CDP-glycerol glycerophosphotransferase (TagB/SpsB family)